MGTFVHIDADDFVLEEIANTRAGTLAKIVEIYERRKDVEDEEIRLNMMEDEEKEIARLHPNAPKLDFLAHGQGLGRLQAWESIQAAGLDKYHGETSDPALMLTILQAQRKYKSAFLGATREEADKCYRRNVEICDRAIAALQAGRIRAVAWY